MAAYGDRDTRVRAASVTSLGHCKGEKVLKTLLHAFEVDSSYAVAAAALRSLTMVDSVHRKMYCDRALKRDSHQEVIRSTALQALADIGDEDALSIIRSYTRYGLERNLRIQAIRSLGTVWKARPDVFGYILTLLNDPSYHVRRALIDLLGSLENPLAVPPLQQYIEHEADSRLIKAARDAISKIQQAEQQKPSH